MQHAYKVNCTCLGRGAVVLIRMISDTVDLNNRINCELFHNYLSTYT